MTSGQTKPRLVFFGNERLVSGLQKTDAPILSGLIERGYDIAAIVAHHSDSRSRNSRPLEVAAIAEKHNIPLLTPDKPIDIIDQLEAFRAEAAVLVAYGRIVPQRVIDIFPRGVINIHPSLLPAYRGPTPIETPILRGESASGISIMSLSAKMDGGPIYAQAEFPIEPRDTKFDVYEKASSLSARLLFEVLPNILDGSLQPVAQNEADATYCHLFSKSDSLLNPSSMSASQADAHIRACLGYPGSRLILGNIEAIITTAHVSDVATELSVKCADGNYLAIDSLKPVGKKEMPARAFLTGYRQALDISHKA